MHAFAVINEHKCLIKRQSTEVMKGLIFIQIVSSTYGKNKPRAINDDYSNPL